MPLNPLAYCSWRIAVLASCAFLSGVAAKAQAPAPLTDNKELNGQIDAFTTRILMICEDTYYLVLPLPVLTCGSNNTSQHCDALLAFRGRAPGDLKGIPQLRWESSRLSPAEELNHIEVHGFVTMDYAATRSRHRLDGRWDDWSDWINKQDQQPYRLGELGKKNGTWSIAMGSDVQIAPAWMRTLAPQSNLTVERIEKGKVSCEEISNSHNRLTAAEVASDAQKMAPLRAMTQTLEEGFKASQYRGLLDGFASQLPALIHQAAVKYGLDPNSYEQETALIADVVRACAHITAEMAQSATPLPGGPVYMDRLGKQYRDCNFGLHNATYEVKPSTWRSQRFISFTMNPTSRERRYGGGFRVDLMFAGMNIAPDPIVRAIIEPASH